MDLLIILIQLIARAFKSPSASAPGAGNPNDLAQQIQARIEASRMQTPPTGNPVAMRPGARAGSVWPGAQRQVRQKPPAFRQRKNMRKRPPALPIPMAAPAAKVVAAKAPDPTPPPPKAAAVFVDARVLTRWLRPQTLRSQFILTEVFQPPIALRESHLS